MSTYAGERTLERGAMARGLDRLLAIEIPTSLEFWLYTGLIVAAVLFRFVDLGARALHHDESLHATYSWYLAQGRGYQHDPLMHGPFLFHITALSFVLFGASDASARFPAALLGSIAVLMPLLLRPWLGKIGAFAAAAFIAFSPSILYYSRFIRDDPFVILFTLAMVVSIFRYRATRHEGWLYLGAASLVLGFTSLEVEFIIAAIVLLYLEGALAHDLMQRIAARRDLSDAARAGLYLLLLPTAWLLALAWPFLERQRLRWGLDEELPANGDLLVLFGLLTAPQFSAAIKVVLKQLHYDLAGGTGYSMSNYLFSFSLTRVEAVGGLTVITLLLLTFILGLWWNQRRWLIAAALFYIPYFLLYTTFLTNKAGWGSGIWGSLSYWLDQQDVRRGTQPVFYFAMTLSTYEYLALGLAAAALLVQAWRRGYEALTLLGAALAALVAGVLVNGHYGNVATIPFMLAALLLATAAMDGDPLRRFLIFYGGAIFWGLSVAGEKMPWLTEHPALPLALLAGLALNDAFGLLPALRDRLSARMWAIIALAGAAGLGAALLTATHTATLRLLGLVLLPAALIVGGYFVLTLLDPAIERRWLRAGGAVAAALFVGFFGLLTLRNDWRLNFIHPDTPDEMLIYTQTSPDIPKIARQIDAFALASGKGKLLRVTVDSYSSFTWPWAWYLRDYPNTSYPDLSTYANNPGGIPQGTLGDVVIVHHTNQPVMAPYATLYSTPEMVHHRSWFPEGWSAPATVAGQTPVAEGYRATTTHRVLAGLFDGSLFARWWTYVTHRDGFAIPPSSVTQYPAAEQPVGQCDPYTSIDGTGRPCLGSEDADVYFPAGYTPGLALALAPPLGGATTAPVTAAGAGGARATAAVNVAPRSEGQTLAFGAAGSVAGALSRPAGIAVDAQGNVYVADSKNDRINKYDASGNFVAASAKLSTNSVVGGTQSPEAWGVAVDAAGNVYVADTWNDRIIKLDPSLKTLTSFGTPVTDVNNPGPGQLYGPRGIMVDADGNIRVADTGDARIVVYNPSGQVLGINGSRGSAPGQFLEPTDIVQLPDGGFAVADTWNNRVQIFDKSFAPRSSFTIPWTSGTTGQDGENKPYLAALPDGTLLLTQPRAGLAQIYDTSGKLLRTLDRLPGMPAGFRDPLGVAASPAGAIYVADGVSDEIDRVPNTALTGSPQG